MIAMALVATMMVVGLTIGCVAADIHFDEQERRLKEEHYLERRLTRLVRAARRWPSRSRKIRPVRTPRASPALAGSRAIPISMMKPPGRINRSGGSTSLRNFDT